MENRFNLPEHIMGLLYALHFLNESVEDILHDAFLEIECYICANHFKSHDHRSGFECIFTKAIVTEEGKCYLPPVAEVELERYRQRTLHEPL